MKVTISVTKQVQALVCDNCSTQQTAPNTPRISTVPVTINGTKQERHICTACVGIAVGALLGVKP